MDNGYYLYAISKDTGKRGTTAAPDSSVQISGIDSKHFVEAITCDGLRAHVSKVSLDEFGHDSFKRNLQDMKWLEAKARSHDRIVRNLSQYATIVPVRFGTVFLSPGGIKDFTGKNAQQLKELLDRLDGFDEMGVTLNFDKRLVTKHLEQTDPSLEKLTKNINEAGSGAAYLLRKKLENSKRERLGSFVDSSVSKVADSLRRRTKEVKQSPLLAHPDDRSLVYVNLNCLVAVKDVESFKKLAASLPEVPTDAGISVRVTGPWPAYSFSTIEPDSVSTSKGDVSHAR